MGLCCVAERMINCRYPIVSLYSESMYRKGVSIMEKMKLETANVAANNVERIGELFPNCITESKGENGQLKRAVNFEMLRQMLSEDVVDGKEAYEFTWVGKKASIVEANKPIRKTLRPCKEESVNWDTTENLYIEGDNLQVLKLLQESYLGKVKMIYIDPPYNTGNDFIYNDDFKMNREDYVEESGEYDDVGNRMFKNEETAGRYHSDWCSMIYSRLLLARNLLSDDGVIFISIDDHEQENLKKICDEVFGQENFIGMLSVENNPKGRKNSDFISISSEYCIILSKNKEKAYFIENIPKKAEDMVLDEEGRYVHNSGKRVLVGENSFNKIVTNVSSDKNYSVYFKKEDYSIAIRKEELGEEDHTLILQGYKKYYSHNKGVLVENTYTKDKFLKLFHKKALDFSVDKVYEKNFNDTIRIKSQLVNREYEAIVKGIKKKYSMELTTTGAGTYLKKLFDTQEVLFTAPKNIGFLKILISLIDSKEMTILDFFSGSATTADAVMQLNLEDGGNRKFIMVQLPKEMEEKSQAYKSGYKTICEIGKERIRRAGQKILSENADKEGVENLDIGFRVLKLDDTNMKDVYFAPQAFTQEMLPTLADNVKEDRTDLDLLFGCLLEWGLPLSLPYSSEVVDGCTIHNYNDGDLMACFDANVPDAVIRHIAKLQPLRAVFRDSSFVDSPSKINVGEIFKSLAPDTRIKVI